ncbi:MAG: ATP-dependent RNA helicase [Acidimicrobiales bacterium]|nr:MAG: ATP-dependent RNA helicase [Acidimicrobiales bacterium]
MTGGGDRDFRLDPFQIEAIGHVDDGRSVLVCAPTGSGKTVVAEHAIDRALGERKRAFYTTPIKALSNQKYRDLAERIGAARVGLLTGDNAINPDADVIVMTTEVLRNMLYEGRDLSDLATVVLDEVHYLEDSFRGPVWEEVILHLPLHVSLVCLSATVSNSDEVGGWLESVRGPTAVIVETTRPVELTNLYAVGDRRGERLHVVPSLVDGRPNPDGDRFDPDLRRSRADRRKHKRPPWRTPSRLELLDFLEDGDLLPVIWFIFSRKGCDEAATSLVRSGARFTDQEQGARIRAIADERLGGLDAGDLALLDTTAWLERLERGVASHHAGLVPAFKEAVEVCFAEGLVKVVFATETLALGVNLPARSVVIDRLTKFTGEHHELLTPAQFTQLTGRAGRRGIDERGHAIVPWSPFTQFDQVSSLAGSRAFRLRSAFRPTYNMAVNLLQRQSPDDARALLARSFAQYQADAGVARLENRLVRERARLTELRAEVDALPEPEEDEPVAADADAIADAVSRLRPGDVVLDDDGDRLAVLGVSWRKGGRARMRLVSQRSQEFRWELSELTEPPVTVGHIDLPQPMAPERIDYRHDVAARLRRTRGAGTTRAKKRSKARNDPRAALARLEQEVQHLERKARRDKGSVARRFDAICAVLRDREHLDGWEVSDSGRMLGRIYHESDLLIAEALDAGLLDDLDPPALASLVSCFTYEHRRPGPPPEPWFPAKAAKQRYRDLVHLARGLAGVERHHDVPETRPPEAGFAPAAHAWAAGEDLGVLLDDDEDMTAGDFVRNVKQLIDLLRQIGEVAPVAATARSARQAAEAIHRGVVAISGSVDAA